MFYPMERRKDSAVPNPVVRGRGAQSAAVPSRFGLAAREADGDWRDHVAALREARAASLDVVGFYHSHPRSEAYPSPTDIAESGYADAMHLIVGRIETGPEARLFTIATAGIVELEMDVR